MRVVDLKASQIESLSEMFDLEGISEIKLVEHTGILAKSRFGSNVCIEICGKRGEGHKRPQGA